MDSLSTSVDKGVKFKNIRGLLDQISGSSSSASFFTPVPLKGQQLDIEAETFP